MLITKLNAAAEIKAPLQSKRACCKSDLMDLLLIRGGRNRYSIVKELIRGKRICDSCKRSIDD